MKWPQVLTEEERVTEVGFVINCRIALRLVRAFKTKVSIELHPAMSRNIGRTLDYARRYYRVYVRSILLLKFL